MIAPDELITERDPRRFHALVEFERDTEYRVATLNSARRFTDAFREASTQHTIQQEDRE